MHRSAAFAFAVLTLVAWPLAAESQQLAKVRRIGYLGATTVSDAGPQLEAIRAGLRDFGYVEGKNIVIEYRWAEGKYDRLPDLAAELVRLKVDVLVTGGTPGALAAKGATTTIPIVMTTSNDAVRRGIVASRARPGGNITGLTSFGPELYVKRLELLKAAVPRLKRVAHLFNPDNSSSAANFKEVEQVATSMKIELSPGEARRPGEFESIFAALAKMRVEAVVISDDAMLLTKSRTIADIEVRKRLPSIGSREFVEAGGMVGFGNNVLERSRRAAYFIDRILKGAKPADLPVERPTTFELVINLKTAKALGVTIPPSLLGRADEVIQ